MEKKCEICQDNLIKTKLYGVYLCEECIISWSEHLYVQKNNYCDWYYVHSNFFYNWERKRRKKLTKKIKKQKDIGPVRSRFEILDL